MEFPSEVGYRYKPLSATDSIRLLRISRADDQPHGLLLSLKEAQLDAQPEFVALSYTWNLPEYINRENWRDQECGETIKVVCDGKAMTVSENLFNFLCAALDASEAGNIAQMKLVAKVNELLKDLPLWIDAFCINQTDAEEKRHQVLLMHRIYAAAKNVIIWLGPAQPHPDVLWVHDKFIPAISKLTRSRPDFVKRHLKKDATCSSVETVEELGPELCARWHSAWLHLVTYIDRQCWFDRGWIVQEVALSDPAGVYICCGRSVLSWKRLAAFAQFLQDIEWSYIIGEHEEDITRNLRSSENKRVVYPEQFSTRVLKISKARTSLAEVAHETGILMDGESIWNATLEQGWLNCANFLIHSLRSSRFGDPRDHINGCLGMLSILLPQGCEGPIVPNYDVTVEELFTSTAGVFMKKSPLLIELSRFEKRSSRRYSKLPSWVPDYSVEKIRHPVGKWNSINRYLDMSISELKETQNKLWGRDLRRPKLVGSALHVYGFMLDTVFEAGTDEPFGWESRIVQALLDNSGPKTADYNGFWKAMATAYREVNKLDYNTSLTDVLKGFCPISENTWQQGTSQRTRKVPPPGWVLKPLDTVSMELLDRKIYSTEGDELGLGPLTVREEDEVWLLEGARTPCVLRRVAPISGHNPQNEDGPDAYEFVEQKIAPRGNRTPGSPTLLDGNGEFYH
ncbi:heterokaryon incompatibility protein [Colletotrichum asianum]|uniref:Heterokaryon incompatibility protein n=1 Tax=Colletotrichum asianum TaxID=702518 RepID=A0A8H3W0P1_9PEZI|nr:heterokaryon incompatibility protein [Colletotrichum asianum]